MRGDLIRWFLFLSILGSGALTNITKAASTYASTQSREDLSTNKPLQLQEAVIPKPLQAVEASPAALHLIREAEQSFAKGELEKADSTYARALAMTPSIPSLLVSAAAVKTRLGKLEESRTMLRKALSLDLDNAAAWKLLGMNALEQKRDDEAFACLAQATLHEDNNPRAHNYLGMAAGRKGWGEASEQELRRAVELDPDYADANFNLAVLYLGRNPPLIELARRHYQRALDLGAKRDSAIENLIAKSVASQPSDSQRSPARP
jgi:tetratricopeptide (TPR) repeat protein